jgi:hypothetical protein
VSDDAPKSAFELAMERLRRKDQEDGVQERPLTDDQRARIADTRSLYQARIAELEILAGSDRTKATTQEELDAVEERYRSERERLARERDRKIEEIRS